MDFILFIKGFIVGFLITAPIGPMGVLCVERTLSNGRRSGFISGMGAVTADGFYSAVAAYGITLVSDLLRDWQVWFRLFGVVFLFFLGVRIIMSGSSAKKMPEGDVNMAGDFVSGFFITIANPATGIAFAAIFAAIGVVERDLNFFSATMLVSGVVSGAALCWFILSSGVNVLRKKFKLEMLRTVRVFFGSVILVFSIALLCVMILRRIA